MNPDHEIARRFMTKRERRRLRPIDYQRAFIRAAHSANPMGDGTFPADFDGNCVTLPKRIEEKRLLAKASEARKMRGKR